MLAPALGRVKIGGAGPDDCPYVKPGREGAAPEEGPAAEFGVPIEAAGFLVKGREKFIVIDAGGDLLLTEFPVGQRGSGYICILSVFVLIYTERAL